MWRRILLILFNIIHSHGTTVQVVNVSLCEEPQEETGELFFDIDSKGTIDQIFSGSFTIPTHLDEDAYFEFASYAWDEENEEWLFLFNGLRSVCNSVLNSLPYRKFSKAVEPNWSLNCPIPADTYEVAHLPISGQYAALSELPDDFPLVSNIVKLWAGDEIVFCREILTLSSD